MAKKLKGVNSPRNNVPERDVLFEEISVTGRNIYKAYGIPDYNPDELVGKKGLEIYSRMREDDQIKAVLWMKKFARLMTSWEIEPASDDERDVEIGKFVKDNLEGMQGTFEDCLLEILTALDYGFSITEELWYRILKGQWAGKIGLKALKTREPLYYMFESDDFGNLREDGIVYGGLISYKQDKAPVTASWLRGEGSWGGVIYGQRLPVNKFVIFSYNKEFSNWYGRSDLRSAYRSWWSKEILIRFMNIYMERFGMPTHVAKYPKGTRKTDRDKLKEVLDKVQAKYSIVIPEDVAIDLLQAGGAGEAGFKLAIEMHNRFMARSILVPDLMGFTEVTSGGSYALGKKHFDVFLWVLKKLGRDIEESIVGEQIIKRLVDLNYQNVEKYPRFKFEDITEEGTHSKALIVAAGVQNGFINPNEPWIRRYLALPKHEGEFPLGVQAEPQRPEDRTTWQPWNMNPKESGELEEEMISAEDRLASQVKGYVNRLKRHYSFADEPIKTQVPVEKFSDKKLVPTKFERKINYKKVDKELTDYMYETTVSLSDIIKRQKDGLLDEIRKKKIFENEETTAVNKLQLKYVGDFKRELESRMVKVYMDAKLEVLKEMVDEDVPIELKYLFQRATIQDWQPVSPVEAIDLFKRKVLAKIVKEDGTKKLIELVTGKELSYYSAKAFAIAGVERDYILNEAKQIILEGLKTGDTQEAIFNLESLFDEYLASGELKDDKLVTPYRLETIVRTNTMEALNSGRKAMMEDKDVKDFVKFWQYSAILDSRTRPSHEALHGRIYKSTDPIWNGPTGIYPPNGWNALLAGAMIRLGDETKRFWKKVENIEVGDYVYTHKGRYRRVVETMNKIWDKGYYEIELQNGWKLKITEDHPVLTKNRGWVEVKDLTLEDDVMTSQNVAVLVQWQSKNAELRREEQGKWMSEARKSGKIYIKKTGKIVFCEYCHKGFYIRKKEKKQHCSIVCASKDGAYSNCLEKNPAWEGGKSFEPYGIDFNDKLRESIRKRDGYKCQECGVSEIELIRKLHVHHIDYNKKNNFEDNLISLCNSCHMKTGWDKNKWTEHYKRMQDENKIYKESSILRNSL